MLRHQQLPLTVKGWDTYIFLNLMEKHLKSWCCFLSSSMFDWQLAGWAEANVVHHINRGWFRTQPWKITTLSIHMCMHALTLIIKIIAYYWYHTEELSKMKKIVKSLHTCTQHADTHGGTISPELMVVRNHITCLTLCVYVCVWERKRERQRERETDGI